MRFIGSKNLLLKNIKELVDRHAPDAYSFCDIFSGTATVARFFKQWFEVYSNDLLYFSYCLQKSTVENDSIPKFERLFIETGVKNPIKFFNMMPTSEMEYLPKSKRFFQNNYSPIGGRMYVTDSNALRVDFSRNSTEEWRRAGYLSDNEYFYLIACIVEGLPFVSNISGTYGAYNKFWDKRSHKLFELIKLPVHHNGKNNRSFNLDGVDLLEFIKGDILYIDPPYNERQYLPNYHVLETAAKYDSPLLHGVTGQRPHDLERSKFCSKKTALAVFDELVTKAQFKHIILSYNTDGIMKLQDIEEIMRCVGKPGSFEVNYYPFRRFKSRNSSNDQNKLKEMLIYVEKN